MNNSGDNISGDNGPAPQLTPKTELAVVAAFLLFFAVKAFYFAFLIGENIFPDEITHFGFAEVYSRSLLPPADSSESYQFGLIKTFPFLYFYLMGKVFPLNIFPVPDLVFLRSVNVLISILTVWFGWKLVRLLVSQPVVRLLFVAMITNTLMFTFISASVNYDNLINLLAVLSLYYLFSFFQYRGSVNILLFVLFTSMGMLTKISFLPFAFLLLVVLLFHERKNLRSLPYLIQPFKWKICLLSILCLFSMAANMHLYLGNLLGYGKLQPAMDEVVGLEQALQNRIFARDYVVRLFSEEKISYLEARNMAFKHIKHPGDRNSALVMVQQSAREKTLKQSPRIDLLRYAFVWTDLMVGRIFGILGHRMMTKNGSELAPYSLLFLAAGVLLVRRIKVSDLQGTGFYLLFIAGAYSLILMLAVNYKSYLSSGLLGSDLQGRYIFPVLIPIYALVAYYLTCLGSKWLKWSVFFIITAIFVYGEFPWFLKNVSPEWFFK